MEKQEIRIDNSRRRKEIAKCKECNGKPKASPINISGFIGEKCELCYEILWWEKSKKK